MLFGHEVVDVTQSDGAVSVDVRGPDGVARHTGAWLIGADGGRSVVRKQCGIAFDGFTWPERFIVLTTPYDFEANRGYCPRSYFADPGRGAIASRCRPTARPACGARCFRPIRRTPRQELMSDAGVQARLQKFFPAPAPYEVVHRNLYVTHQRVAATFRKGRVLLAGDAAHVNNPIGGMGLNGGIQDAVNLSDKLARILLDGDADRLLDLYDLQRRTVAVEFVQEQSIANKKRLEASDPEMRKTQSRRAAADRGRPGARAPVPAAHRHDREPAPRRNHRARRGNTMTATDTRMTPAMRPYLSQTARFASGKDSPRDFLERCLAELDRWEPKIGAFVTPQPRRRAPERRPRHRALARRSSRCRRSTACRSASRTSSRPSTCRPRWARRCSPAGARSATPPRSRRCAKPAPSSSARP